MLSSQRWNSTFGDYELRSATMSKNPANSMFLLCGRQSKGTASDSLLMSFRAMQIERQDQSSDGYDSLLSWEKFDRIVSTMPSQCLQF